MDTSYVAVGTVMSMITDSLTCRPQKNPAGAGRRCRYCAPAIHAAQNERAGRRGDNHTRPALPPAAPRRSSQRHGHLTRSRPQDSPSNAAVPQWEPRKPFAGRRKARRSGVRSYLLWREALQRRDIPKLVPINNILIFAQINSVLVVSGNDCLGWRISG